LLSENLTQEALAWFEDFKVGLVMHTVKYTEDLVLLAKEEMVLQGTIDGPTAIGKCYGMEINVEENIR
jgi:hypothetical protein